MADKLRESRNELEKTLDDIRVARQRLQVFFEQSTDILGIAGYDTRILYANSAFLIGLGYSAEEVTRMSYLDLVHPDDLSMSRDAVVRLSEGNSLSRFENRFRACDGSYRRIAWSIASDAQARCIYATGRDITEERKLEEEVVRAAAAEQERIAHDLHDGVGQLMTGLAFKAKLMEHDLLAGVVPAPAQAAELVALANRASAEVRSLARGIDPVELQQGLVPALEYLAVTTASTFDVACTLHSDLPVDAIDKPRAIHLYRIAQEAVNNAIKHGKAERVDLHLAREGNRITLSVSDDGCGLKGQPEPGNGQGFRIMNFRAKLIGGHLTVTAKPGCGLLVTCTIEAAT